MTHHGACGPWTDRTGARTVDPVDFQAAVGDAVTGYVHVDLLVEVASGFDALPARTVAVEVEPAHRARRGAQPGCGRCPRAGAAAGARRGAAGSAPLGLAAELQWSLLPPLLDELSVLEEDDR
jgi:hypothetical protein